MAQRFNLLPPTVSFPDPEDRALVEQIRQQRGPGGLSDLDRALLYNAKTTSGWKTFFSAIRTSSSISDTLRELAISRLGIVNGVPIEYETHSALLLKCAQGSITPEALEYVQNTALHAHNLGDSAPGGLEAEHIAVLAYTDSVCREIKVSGVVFDELKRHFDQRRILDLTMLIAAYNCVSRIVVPLQLFGMEY